MKNLKRVLLLMGIITFALALTACGGTEDKVSTEKKETAKAETKEKRKQIQIHLAIIK